MSDNTDTNAAELAQDLEQSITALIDLLNFEDAEEIDAPGMGGLFSLDPEMVVGMVLPYVNQYVRENPEQTIEAAAILHLELGAIVEKHDDRTPEQIVEEPIDV